MGPDDLTTDFDGGVSQASLYRLLNLVAAGAVPREALGRVRKDSFVTAVVMTSRFPGWASPSEMVALARKDGFRHIVPAAGPRPPAGLERDIMTVMRKDPEARRAFEAHDLLLDVMGCK